ncbi:hypothetical protein GCM10025858_01700 [Alicyclobacillus sacchari]|nr:hypothetical protein GCM10025858_01700 [Alicyclobacillus sacchari]
MMIKEWLIGVGIAVLAFLGMLHVVQILPILFLIGLGVLLWVVMDRRNAAAPAAREAAARPSISFEEIGGQESAKHELKEALDFLRYRDRIQSLGIRPIKGILLTGPRERARP